MSYEIAPGGLAAVLAHPDDESVGCAGALAASHPRARIGGPADSIGVLVTSDGSECLTDGRSRPSLLRFCSAPAASPESCGPRPGL